MKALDSFNPKFLEFEGTPTEIETYELFNELGLVQWPQSGVPQFSNPGQKMMENTAQTIREGFQRSGFNELRFPTLQDPEIYEKTGRNEQFEDEFFDAGENLIIAPTQEEAFLTEARKRLHSEKHLPLKFFEITYKFRDCEPARGIMRNREFEMADAFSLHEDEDSLEDEIDNYEKMVIGLADDLGLNLEKVEKEERPYVSYVVKTQDGAVEFDGGKVGSDVAMYYVADEEMLDNFDFKIPQPMLCSYGIGVSRLLHAVLEENKEENYIDLPDEIRPYDYSIIPVEAGNSDHLDYAEQIYNELRDSGVDVLLDDRKSRGIREKQRQHRFYGVDEALILGDNEIQEDYVTLADPEKDKKVDFEDLI